MSERNVLAVLASNREAYELYHQQIGTDDFSDVGREVFKYIGEFYTRDPEAGAVDTSSMRSHLSTVLIGGDSAINGLLDFEDVSLPNAAEAVRRQVLRARGLALAELLMIGDPDARGLEEALLLYNNTYNNTYIIDTNDTEEDILALFNNNADKLKVYPASLDDHLEGGLSRGSTTTIFARPEMGKSLFSINLASGWCHDGNVVLYIGNEDAKRKMIQRFITRFTGWEKQSVIDAPQKALHLAYDRGMVNLHFRHYASDTQTAADLNALTKEIGPDAVVVDQVFNLHVHGAETGSINAIRQLAPAMRQVAQLHDCVMLQVAQAGDSGEGKAELGMGDMEGTNTAHQAQQDVIIGIGGNEMMKKSGHRRLSFPKNKESGNHATVPVLFNDRLNKVLDG